MIYKFYDTSSLLMRVDDLFNDPEEQVIISTISLKELEEIKTSANKNEDIKYAARKLTALLGANPDKYTAWIFNMDMLEPVSNFGITNDIKILATALDYDQRCHPDETIFVTNDLALKNIANTVFGSDSIEGITVEEDTYSGYKEVYLDQQDMSKFYSNLQYNTFDLMINEYVVIHEAETGDIVDCWRWNGDGHVALRYGSFPSDHFGNIKPMKDDIYQAMAADSLSHNKITMLKGPAGSGKTILSLGYLMNRLEKGTLEKIIVFCNTVATVNSARLGFYPGSRNEKLLDSQIGNLLASKFGGRVEVERMIEEEKLVLLPLSDIRGYDTTGMKAGIYISEAQNLDITLMKLALQRIGEDSICIIDGDNKTQVDDKSFAGSHNGMRRASKVFRGADIYGEVELKQIHRSRIAQLAEAM